MNRRRSWGTLDAYELVVLRTPPGKKVPESARPDRTEPEARKRGPRWRRFAWRRRGPSELAAASAAEAGPAEDVEPAEEPAEAKPDEGTRRRTYEAPRWRREPPFEDLFGLALSGGGIRSATFNLGLIQGLHRLGLLQAFHYVATVSGGGYVAGFWSAWQGRTGGDRWGRFPDRPAREAEPREVRHLREFSNFLKPRLLLLSFETGRLVAALVGAIVPSVVGALAVLLVGLYVWLGAAWGLFSDRVVVAVGGLALLTLLVHFAWELLWSFRPEEPRARARRWYWAFAAAALLFAGLAYGALWNILPLPFEHLLRPVRSLDATGPVLRTLLAPTLAWLFAGALLLGVRVALSRFAGGDISGRVRSGALDRAIARVLLCAAGWMALSGVWTLGLLLAGMGVAGVLAAFGTGGAGGALFGWSRRLLGVGQHHKPSGGKLWPRARPQLVKLIGYVTLAAFASAGASLIVFLTDRFGSVGLGSGLAAALVVVGFTLLFFEPHENGFHAFYRARLVRAFLGASNVQAPPRAPHGATAECEGDDVLFDCLPNRPLHLVCCTANDLWGDPLPTLHRGGESATLSRLAFQIGNHWSRPKDLPRMPSLGDAMTASAAAFNSHMGGLSMQLGQGATFLLAALGLRLGLWLPSPASDPSALGLFMRWLDRVATRIGAWLPGRLFLRELLGFSSAGSAWVHLSDGAHFENLALYELVRRHCRFILLSDCGADPDRAFDDFGNAVRRVREDFGVEIRIDISPLRPDEHGLSRQPAVAGDIQYGPNDNGILIYVKPARIGNEPPDVVHYAGRNRRFPHETTLDQFYDEAQWESYRRLGQHVVDSALAVLREEWER